MWVAPPRPPRRDAAGAARPRPTIAMDYLRANRDALGLDAADLAGLEPPAPREHPARAHRRALPPALPRHPRLRQRRARRDRPRRARALGRRARRGATSASPRSTRASAAPRRSPALQKNVGVERSLPVTLRPVRRAAHHELQGRRLRPARAVRHRRRREARLACDLPRDSRPRSTTPSSTLPSGAVLYRQNLVKAVANAAGLPQPSRATALPQTVDLEDYGLPAGSTVSRRRLVEASGPTSTTTTSPTRRSAPGRAPARYFVYPFTPFTPGPSCPADGAVRVGPLGPRLVGDEPRLRTPCRPSTSSPASTTTSPVTTSPSPTPPATSRSAAPAATTPC